MAGSQQRSETDDDINVYFDNLTITHTGLQVVEQTDYYPYGMVMRKETPGQGQGVYNRYRHGYQGQFSEKDEETGWNHFELRQYGSRIGRWTATDPYRQYASPYVGMGNNPVSRVDPDGGIALPDLSFLNDPVFQSFAGGSIFLDNVNIFAQNGSGNTGADWSEIGDGIITTTGGLISTGFGVAGVLTGVGVAPGAIGIIAGGPMIGFGIAKIIDGAKGGSKKDKMPGGLLEAVDIGVGGDGSIGQIGDIFLGGLPKNTASGLIMGYGIYNSNYGQMLFNSGSSNTSNGNTFGPYIVPADNVRFIIPKKIK